MIFKSTNKVIDRLEQMIDRAINGVPVETTYDETKLSSLETKLASFLAMNQRQKEELEQEKSRINELISDISHQTKTPIANILLYSQLMDEEMQSSENSLSDSGKNYMKLLVSQAEKLDFLIASLMKTSRLESGIIMIEAGQQPVDVLLRNSIEQIRAKAEQKNITIRINKVDTSGTHEVVYDSANDNINESLNKNWDNIVVSCDLKWTTEAVFNILDNAVKYSGEETKIGISVTPYQMFCRIDIADEGIGISEGEQAKIFSRFYRSERVRNQDGVGLGLYLAREIITRQGGYIKVSSGKSRGSVFSVFLPLKERNLSEL